MMEAARSLLSAVTKLLLLADHVDLSQILPSVAETERHLGQLRGCRASPGGGEGRGGGAGEDGQEAAGPLGPG